MAILDSDIIIDYLREKQAAVDAIKDLLKNGAIIRTTAFNYFEVYFGAIAFEKNSRKIEKTQVFLDSLEILFPNLESFRKSAEIQLTLRKKGRTTGPVDIFIAGIVAMQQETLYTKNVKDYSAIPEIRTAVY